MTAKIVMVVQYQDASVAPVRLAIEVRRRQAADTGTDNDKVIGLAGLVGAENSAVARLVSCLE
jgi:hypothetical protein